MTDDAEVLAGIRALLRPVVQQLVAAELEERGQQQGAGAEGFIGTAEAARRAGLQPAAVRAWIAKGILPATKVPGARGWKVRLSDLEAVLAGQSGGHAPVLDLEAKRRAVVAAARKDRG